MLKLTEKEDFLKAGFDKKKESGIFYLQR